jgi:predicted transcriptional regulator
MTTEERNAAIKLQITLTAIATKKRVFFNVAQYLQMGLVREHGKDHKLRTNWVLTEKGKQFLNVMIP